MLMPIIQADEQHTEFPAENISTETANASVSIGKLSNFIDFFNYFPLMMNKIKHKNDTSQDLYLFMGKVNHNQK